MKRNIKFENEIIKKSVNYINDHYNLNSISNFVNDWEKCNYAHVIDCGVIDLEIGDYLFLLKASDGFSYKKSRAALHKIYDTICEQLDF